MVGSISPVDEPGTFQQSSLLHKKGRDTSQLWDVGSHPETFTSWHLEMAFHAVSMAFLRHFHGVSMARVALARIAKDTSVPSLP